ARAAGIAGGCHNPFQSIVVRSIETLYAVEEALRIVEEYPEPAYPAADFAAVAGSGYGCSEAPRGILYHRYVIDDTGAIVAARIVPPTAQNQATIEDDLRGFVPTRVNLPLNELTWQCEQAIRNYDPCISCSTHFLRLTLNAMTT
ncbi:MAG: nickel-dependent hydrogenase large subunit, partial [Caldilineaceae bacterium]|nr:nickel-dependent hydrogenase large subunit [Caldilineaceae bacterium]